MFEKSPIFKPSLSFYANRRTWNGEQVSRLARPALKGKPSVSFGGFWQRHATAS